MKMDMETIEKNVRKMTLLSPAGSRESLIAAVQNGADAVYLGGSALRGALRIILTIPHCAGRSTIAMRAALLCM